MHAYRRKTTVNHPACASQQWAYTCRQKASGYSPHGSLKEAAHGRRDADLIVCFYPVEQVAKTMCHQSLPHAGGTPNPRNAYLYGLIAVNASPSLSCYAELCHFIKSLQENSRHATQHANMGQKCEHTVNNLDPFSAHCPTIIRENRVRGP